MLRFWLENIREDMATIRGICVGLYMDGNVVPETNFVPCIDSAAHDDIAGLREWRDMSDTLWPAGTVLFTWDGMGYDSANVGGVPKYYSLCEYVTIFWLADDDGMHPEPCSGLGISNAVTGLRSMLTLWPHLSYHWWFSHEDDSLDWGPFDPSDPRDVEGTPVGDAAKYYMMTNEYVDRDQVCDSLVYPPEVDSVNDTQFLLSLAFGDLAFGNTLEVAFAYVGGQRFHSGAVWCDWSFDDIADNANWAYGVYDNPGFDSDGDGYAGDFVRIDGETLYISGDSIPDYCIPKDPPPNPCGIVTGVVEGYAGVKRSLPELRQNSPNPFHHRTAVGFSLPNRRRVSIRIFDTAGRVVSHLLDDHLPAGVHSNEWDGGGIPSGIYFCRLQAGDFTDVKKMILLR
jgi:hypothetical protein